MQIYLYTVAFVEAKVEANLAVGGGWFNAAGYYAYADTTYSRPSPKSSLSPFQPTA